MNCLRRVAWTVVRLNVMKSKDLLVSVKQIPWSLSITSKRSTDKALAEQRLKLLAHAQLLSLCRSRIRLNKRGKVPRNFDYFIWLA